MNGLYALERAFTGRLAVSQLTLEVRIGSQLMLHVVKERLHSTLSLMHASCCKTSCTSSSEHVMTPLSPGCPPFGFVPQDSVGQLALGCSVKLALGCRDKRLLEGSTAIRNI